MAMTADQLPDDPDALKAMVLARDVENARLHQIIKELQRHRFGRRAETLPEDQLLLGLEEAEQIEAAGEEAKEQVASAERNAKAAKRRANRGALPPHLPRIETVVDIDDHACPCCRNGLHRIGEDVSERLDIIPAQLRVVVVRRPKYACRACEGVVVQAPAPSRLASLCACGGFKLIGQQPSDLGLMPCQDRTFRCAALQYPLARKDNCVDHTYEDNGNNNGHKEAHVDHPLSTADDPSANRSVARGENSYSVPPENRREDHEDGEDFQTAEQHRQ